MHALYMSLVLLTGFESSLVLFSLKNSDFTKINALLDLPDFLVKYRSIKY